MPKANKQVIVDNIIKYIEAGKTFGTVLKLNESKWRLSKSTFNRYWKTAQEQHKAKQDAIKKELADIDKQNAINARKKAIMTADDRKVFLSALINKPLKIMKVGGSTQMVHEYLDKNGNQATEILGYEHKLKAIAELNKMEGDYSPTKVAQTDTKGNDLINNKTDDELKLLLTQALAMLKD